MAAILKSSILNSDIFDSAILHKTVTQTNFNLTQIPSFSLKLMMAAIFNLVILDLTILVFPLILTHTCQEYFPPFAQKKHTLICHSHLTCMMTASLIQFWLNLMIPAILDSAILNFSIWNWTQPFCTRLWTQTNSICPQKTSLIHSDSNWWWQPSWILPCWIQTFCTNLGFRHLPLSTLRSDSTWWWQPSWILPFWIQPLCTKLCTQD